MTFDRQRCIVAVHARAVVADADQPATPFFEVDVDRGGSGVQCVFDQLLHHRCRPVDDFTGGNLVSDFTREQRDTSHVTAKC